MLARCIYPTTINYKWYGAKGITVCVQWRDFAMFRTWAESTGYVPGLTIERKDSGGHYCPENCEWVTRAENARRMRAEDLTILEALGERKTLAEWVADPRCGVSWRTLKGRIERGWTHERAITEPLHNRGRRDL
jgi:hypothetical protein